MAKLNITKIKPLFNRIIVTTNRYEEDVKENGIIVTTAGSLKEYQTVVAIGTTVHGINVGDKVMINPARYVDVKQKENPSLKDDLTITHSSVLTYKFNTVDINGVPHLVLFDNDIEYIFEGEEIEDKIITPVTPKIIV